MRHIKEFQILDINAVDNGLDIYHLMNNAGNSLAEHILDQFSDCTSFIFVCGKGNNAGDGYVAASKLHANNIDVIVINVEGEVKPIPQKALEQYKGRIESVNFLNTLSNGNTLLIDCLLGSGIKGEPKESYGEIIDKINNFKNILSVDVPSGFLKNKTVVPTQTITFHDTKSGMSKSNSGDIFVTDIGITEFIDQSCGPGELRLFPDFNPNNHKGQNGRVAIVGGGVYSGAPSLAGIGAYRTGVDLVHVFVPASSFDQVSKFAPELMVHKLESEYITEEVVEVLRQHNFDSIIIGPGMGKMDESLSSTSSIISNFDNLVIDADAINTYNFRRKNILLTPHLGELARLDVNSSEEDLMSFSKKHGVTLLLKGKIDFMTDGYNLKRNYTGHPRMAVGGTGDLLAGVCGGFMARGLSPFESARLGSYVIGLAGQQCYEEIGPGFIPSDLSVFISKILGKK
ncbi:MAG: NAD(P)H-hydrate dehydratase [Candidatus Poseidoniales archaeon]